MLTIDTILQVEALFVDKGWPLLSELSREESEFDRFCEMLAYLTEDERTLIIELSKDFLWIRYEQYVSVLYSVHAKLIDHCIRNNVEEVIFIPLISPNDRDREKTKSSHFVYYVMRHIIAKQNCKHGNIKQTCVDSPADVQTKKLSSNQILCLVDDFIGTGSTAESTLIELKDRCGIDYSRLAILVLVCQKAGFDCIKSLTSGKAELFHGHYRERAFSDSPEPLEEKIAIMKQIEKKMKVKRKFQFGYKGSEALVALINTPNNTFPVYWLQADAVPVVPFPRTRSEGLR